MATTAQATYNQAGLSGAFDKNKFNAQFHAIHQGDFEALRPRAQATPNMTLQVQAATVQSFYRHVYFNNAQSTFAGGNSPTLTAPTTNPRIDLLYLSDTGVLTVLQGTEAASPVPPAYPDLSKNFPICEVFLRVGMTTIVNFEDSGANPTQGYIYRDVRPWFWSGGVSAHGSLTGLTGTDHHTQYALLAGRALGQTLQGGTAASEKLILESTAHATKGSIRVKDALELDDKAADPATAGYVQRNGASLRFHDGTAARDILMSNKAAGGDLSGTYPNPTVAKLQARTLASTAPADGQVIKWNNGLMQWEPATLAATLEAGTWSDVTGSRTFATAYTNSSGKKRRVSITVACAHGSAPSQNCFAEVLVAGAIIARAGKATTASELGLAATLYFQLFVEVPNGSTVQLNKNESGGGTVTLHKWLEMDE